MAWRMWTGRTSIGLVDFAVCMVILVPCCDWLSDAPSWRWLLERHGFPKKPIAFRQKGTRIREWLPQHQNRSSKICWPKRKWLRLNIFSAAVLDWKTREKLPQNSGHQFVNWVAERVFSFSLKSSTRFLAQHRISSETLAREKVAAIQPQSATKNSGLWLLSSNAFQVFWDSGNVLGGDYFSSVLSAFEIVNR